MSTLTSTPPESDIFGRTPVVEDPTDVDVIRARAPHDTGLFCRKVLGYDYWKTEDREIIRPGGVVAYGPHYQLTRFIDAPFRPGRNRFREVKAPRKSLKTTIGGGYVLRNIVKNPNIRVMILMETQAAARKTVQLLKQHIEGEIKDSNFVDYYGDWKGEPWSGSFFNVNQRDMAIRGYTVEALGVGSNYTGDRADIIWIDDPLSWQRAREKEQVTKVIEAFDYALPLLEEGGEVLVTLTPYAPGDLADHIRELDDAFQVFEEPCGYLLLPQADGKISLEPDPDWPGGARWPNLPKERLEEIAKIYHPNPHVFNAQYGLNITRGDKRLMDPESFKSERWDEKWHSRLNGFVFTDTAVTAKEDSCFNVAILGLIDPADKLYLVDAVIGRMDEIDFIEQTVRMMAHWQSRVRICGTLIEGVALSRAFQTTMDRICQERGVHLHWIRMPRTVQHPVKAERIQGYSARVQSGGVIVLDTFPRTFMDCGTEKVLWNPCAKVGGGHLPNAAPIPGGELVEQHVRFRPGGKQAYPMDIPDALSAVDLRHSDGKRFVWQTPKTIVRPMAYHQDDLFRDDRHGRKRAPLYNRLSRRLR